MSMRLPILPPSNPNDQQREATTISSAARARPARGSRLPALVELSTLVGYYGTLAPQMRVFRVV
jgi:hypothetical protein